MTYREFNADAADTVSVWPGRRQVHARGKDGASRCGLPMPYIAGNSWRKARYTEYEPCQACARIMGRQPDPIPPFEGPPCGGIHDSECLGRWCSGGCGSCPCHWNPW